MAQRAVPCRHQSTVSIPPFDLSAQDAVTWLRAQPGESIDLVITDPAYESLEKHRAIGTTTRLKHSKSSSNDWFTVFPNARFGELFAEVYRVLRRNTHFYLFCDAETMFVAKPEAERAGFQFWKPLVWDKTHDRHGLPLPRALRVHPVLREGQAAAQRSGHCGRHRRCRASTAAIPAEKPPAVSEVLIGRARSRATSLPIRSWAPAASAWRPRRLGRRFLGNDINPEAVRLSVRAAARLRRGTRTRRLAAKRAQPDLLETAGRAP